MKQLLAVLLLLPALALGAERPDPGLMRQPPRPAHERLLSWPLLARAYLWLGLIQAAVARARTKACAISICCGVEVIAKRGVIA